jgi:hypothetical protein
MISEATTDPVATLFVRWRPRLLSSEVATFSRETAARACPDTAARTKALLFALGKLGTFAAAVGLELVPQVCLHRSVIERFIVVGCRDLSAATTRTLRTNLRFVARRTVGDLAPEPVRLPRGRHIRAPTSGGCSPSVTPSRPAARRHRLVALIAVGAGARLMGAELPAVQGDHVVARSSGLLVVVGGRRPRAVPVLARFHTRLGAAAAFAGEGLLIGGLEERRRNVTSDLVAAVAGGADLPRLELGRLRATWLSSCAEGLGLRAFMDAAGITCSQRLGDLLAELPAVDEEVAVALLQGVS